MLVLLHLSAVRSSLGSGLSTPRREAELLEVERLRLFETCRGLRFKSWCWGLHLLRLG